MSKYLLIIGFLMLLSSCYLGGVDAKDLHDAKKAYTDRLAQKSLIFMSLETMFPDPKVRNLAKAASRGQVRKINELAAQGIDVNSRGAQNATPLFLAMGNIKGFKRLLELGASPNQIFGDGSSIMYWVAIHSDVRFLKLALEYEGNPNLVAGSLKETPIFSMMGPDNKNKIPIIIQAGADMNYQRSNGETPIMVAAGLGQFDTVLYLLEQGADYKIRNVYNQNTLMDVIAFRRTTMDPKNNLTKWMNKVIDWLEKKGQTIPVSRPTS